MKSIITTSTIWIFVNYFVSLQCDCHQTQEIWEKMVDKQALRQEMVDKWSIKPSLAEKMADILAFVVDKGEITTASIVSHFGYPPTTAKRHLRQLAEFGYLQAHGGNKNRTYRGSSLPLR